VALIRLADQEQAGGAVFDGVAGHILAAALAAENHGVHGLQLVEVVVPAVVGPYHRAFGLALAGVVPHVGAVVVAKLVRTQRLAVGCEDLQHRRCGVGNEEVQREALKVAATAVRLQVAGWLQVELGKLLGHEVGRRPAALGAGPPPIVGGRGQGLDGFLGRRDVEGLGQSHVVMGPGSMAWFPAQRRQLQDGLDAGARFAASEPPAAATSAALSAGAPVVPSPAPPVVASAAVSGGG